MTISLASLAISVPLPMANPTSAVFRAGASLIPSPVMPTTMSRLWAMLTSRFLSEGTALATTRSSGSRTMSSSSDILFRSSLVNTAFLSFSFINPASRAMAKAVSLLSPVIMTTCTPAWFTCLIAWTASRRISSFMRTIPTKVMPLEGRATGLSLMAIARSLSAFRVALFM